MSKFKPQYRRMIFIDKKIHEGKYPNCKSLASEWEVSSKTIKRDIDYIKYELNAPIEYDATHHGYYYTEKNYQLPAISMSESDLFAICIAERALKQFERTPLYNKLVSVFDKIEDALPDNTSLSPAWIHDRIFFIPEASTIINPHIWETLAQALYKNRQVQITYLSPSGNKKTLRNIDPYHLVNFKGEWYLSSNCHLKQAIRTFAVSRIKKAKLLNDEFIMPKNFDRKKMFGDQLGIIWNNISHNVKIRFSPKIAPYIKERKWHPAQKITTNKNGSITIEFSTMHINEVKDWVLSWGSGAKVIAPKTLINAIKTDLKASLLHYKQP